MNIYVYIILYFLIYDRGVTIKLESPGQCQVSVGSHVIILPKFFIIKFKKKTNHFYCLL